MRECSAVILAAALGALAAAGCTAPQASYGPSVSAAGQAAPAGSGGAWEVVFPGGDTGPALASGFEVSRLDGQLVRGQANVIDESYWPEPRTDSLHRLRRHYFRGHPGEVTYYRNPPHYPEPRQPYWRWNW